MKAILSVLVVAAILGFLVWQRWDEGNSIEPASAPAVSEIEPERPLSSFAPTTTGAEKPSTPPAESAAPPIPVEREEEPRLSHPDFTRDSSGGDALNALRRASSALVASDDSPERDRYLSDVLALSGKLLLSKQASPDASFDHVIASGDTLDKLTRRWKKERGLDLTSEFLLRVNGISDPRRLVLGQRIKVVTATPTLHVDKARHRLDYMLNGAIVREYKVGLGKNDKTPEGTFAIASRLDSPVWFNAGESIPYGDPRNILGTRWLGFENREGMVGFGIHGTNDETTIGLDLSNGCVRMRNRDVEELFDLVPIGTRITVIP